LPGFDARAALAIVRECGLDLPFIIVSGQIGEEVAVEALRNGAHDFLTKDNLERLERAVERELREVDIRREQQRIKDQLLISDRMASVGILAAGVGHEINNPLAVLLLNLGVVDTNVKRVRAELGDSHLLTAIDAGLAEARQAAERVRNIVRDLKFFASPESETRGPVDLQRILDSSLRMVSTEIRHRARLVTDFAEVPPVLAIEARLGQVFLNLLVNAAQAIPEGRSGKNQIRVSTRVEGNFARIEIADTGTGIPPEILKRLFTPFVTTKPVGVGTGLGLSICHRIVTEAGGDIRVETKVGSGTVFVVRLPLAVSAEPPAAVEAVTTGATPRGSILIVDDEPMIGDVLRRSLVHEHDVAAVSRARDALDRIAGGERFDVILSDLMMPEMTGMDLHAELARIAPDQASALVFMTGGAFTASAREFLDRVSNPWLDKPFDLEELQALVRDRVRIRRNRQDTPGSSVK